MLSTRKKVQLPTSTAFLCYTPLMMHLRLRENERSLFEQLPDSLQDGWTIEEEMRWHEDSPHALCTRLSLLRSHVPHIQKLKDQLRSTTSEKDILMTLHAFDLHALSHEELLDLFFVLGPSLLSEWIAESLKEAESDTDLLRIAALTEVRCSDEG